MYFFFQIAVFLNFHVLVIRVGLKWSICYWCLQTCSLPVEIFSHVVIKQVLAANSHGFPWYAMYRLVSDSLQLQCEALVLGTFSFELRFEATISYIHIS